MEEPSNKTNPDTEVNASVSSEGTVDNANEKVSSSKDMKDNDKDNTSENESVKIETAKVVDVENTEPDEEVVVVEDVNVSSASALIENQVKNDPLSRLKEASDDNVIVLESDVTDSYGDSTLGHSSRQKAKTDELECFEPPAKRTRIETESLTTSPHIDNAGESGIIEIIGNSAKECKSETKISLVQNIDLTVAENRTHAEMIQGENDAEVTQIQADNVLKQTKTDTDVILIDETNTDSRGSAATDDDVILVEDSAKESSADVGQGSSTADSLLYDFRRTPRLITGAWKCFESSNNENYLRGCKWAPDGTCLLSNSNDNCLRLFNLPQEMYVEGGENMNIAEMVPVLKMKEADTIYDYCWYPLMSSANPETACLAVTCKDTPIHLYDAFTGELRCSYRAFNHVDEVAAAYSLSFTPDGSKLYCGFNKMIRVFDVTRPGREFENRPTFAKQGQSGIISCIAHSPSEPGLYAAGSYARTIALYHEPQGEMICMFQGQQGGVTQMAFSPDGTKLYSGGRKDPEILCWDMRNPGQILFSLIRRVETNQRIYFDQTLDGKYIVSGSHDSSVLVWDTQQPPAMILPDSDPVLKPTKIFPAHKDTVNGVSLHPSLPLIATSSGRRHFPDIYDSDDSDIENNDNDNVVDNSLKLWWL